MPIYLSPGIYIEELDSGPRPIEAVGTSTAGFVGTAPNADAHIGEANLLVSEEKFIEMYVREGDRSTDLSNAVFGFFRNGGSRCYVVNMKQGEPISKGLDLLSRYDEIAIIAAPGMTDAASYGALLDNAELLGDRVAILDAPSTVDNVEALTRIAEVTAPASDGDGGSKDGGTSKSKPSSGFRPRNSDSGYGAFYFPWLRMQDRLPRTRSYRFPRRAIWPASMLAPIPNAASIRRRPISN